MAAGIENTAAVKLREENVPKGKERTYGKKIHLSRTNKRLSSRLLQTVAILLINALFLCLFSFQTGDREVLSKMGSRGGEVRTIQTKLKNWGYFFDKVDGIYGEKTRDAVIWFQKRTA